MTNMFSLADKTAIVTGANTGLGQGMCVALAQAGANIAGVGRSDMSETSALVQETGRAFHGIYADLNSSKPAEHIVEETVKVFGAVDILVNNAGVIRRDEALNFSEEDWDAVLNVNLRTLFFLCQAAARQFIRQCTKGKIINVASLLSFQGGIHVPSYTASKSGVMGLTKELANEWARYSINVNAIAPGYMVTNITQNLREDGKRYQEILDRIPAGRWGKPEDLGGVTVFLASDASDYVHGATIAVDGGWLGR